MWITSRRKRCSFFFPVFLFLVSAALLSTSLVKLSSSPSLGVVIGCLLMVGLMLLVLADVNFAIERGSTISKSASTTSSLMMSRRKA